MSAGSPQFSDWLACNNLVTRWSWAYDSKNLESLREFCTPTINLDYSGLPQGRQMTNPDAPVDILINTLNRSLGRQDVAGMKIVSNLLIEFGEDGLTGKARGYVNGRHQKDDQSANMWGPVYWEFKKVDGIWYLSGIRPEKPWIKEGNTTVDQMMGRVKNAEGYYEYPTNGHPVKT